MNWLHLAALVELAGAIILVGYLLKAVRPLLAFDADAARLLVTEGGIAALSFQTAAILLKTLESATWNQAGIFMAVFALRSFLKRVFILEQKRLRSRQDQESQGGVLVTHQPGRQDRCE